MKKLSQSALSKIKKLRREGYSYREIAKITGSSVGTVFNYARMVLVSQAGLNRLKNLQTATRNKFVEKFGQCKTIMIQHKNMTAGKLEFLVTACLMVSSQNT